MSDPFVFRISFSILEQLGRGLYRNFITILGEAISNSWDADASNVYIDIGKDSFTIKDDGEGMTDEQFQDRFLKIGYSKRKDNPSATSRRGRPFIGRKGIGKLALLSCADKITILTKSKNQSQQGYIGGTIINEDLDKAIKDDIKPSDYHLREADPSIIEKYTHGHEHGTIIHFQKLKFSMNRDEFLRKLIAMHFRFSLHDKDSDFHIHLNGEEITTNDLKELVNNTEFVWEINEHRKNDALFEQIKQTALEKCVGANSIKIPTLPINGFIASVKKPRNLNILGVKERTGVDFYVNGRLRQTNLLRGTVVTQYVASYLYGQIHYDELDSSKDDPFTTSREGVRPGNKDYEKFLEAIEPCLSNTIPKQWDQWRRAHKQDGDPENMSIPKHQRKIQESSNARVEDFEEKIDTLSLEQNTKKRMKDKLRDLSYYNTQIYQDLFILENLFREHLKTKGLYSFDALRRKLPDNDKEKYNCIRHAEQNKKRSDSTVESNPLRPIRKNEGDLNYFDLICLALFIEMESGTTPRNRRIEPATKLVYDVRNAVMHTNEITEEVKEWGQIDDLIDVMIDKKIKQQRHGKKG